MTHLFKTLTAGLALTWSLSASAVVLDGGPIFGPPIDVSGATHVGSVASGGMTSTYNNLGNSAVANIYFGLNSTGGPWGWSGDFGNSVSAGEAFSWFADSGTTIEYRGSTTINTAFGNPSTQTRLVLTALSGGTVVSDAQTQTLGNSVHSLFQWTGGTFQVKREIEVFNGSSWVDAIPYFNGLSTMGQQAVTNLATGFYWENNAAVPIPVPGTLGLVGVALLGLALRRSKPV